MALLLMDGFDFYSTASQVTACAEITDSGKYNSVASKNLTGNTDIPYVDGNGQSLQVYTTNGDYFITKELTMTGNKVIVAFYLKRTVNDPYSSYYASWGAVRNGSSAYHFHLFSDSDQSLFYLCRHTHGYNTSPIKISETAISVPLNTWVHIAMEVELATDATGSAKVYRDGVLIINELNVITTNQTIDGIIEFLSPYSSHSQIDPRVLIDDLVIMDGSGSKHNTFDKIQRILPLVPTSDYEIGANMAALNAGAHYVEVDDDNFEGSETTYVSSNTIGERSLYGIEDAATIWTDAGDVEAVEVTQYVGTDDVGGTTVRNVIHDGTNTVESGDVVITTQTPKPVNTVFTDAADAGDWTLAKLQALKIGHKHQA